MSILGRIVLIFSVGGIFACFLFVNLGPLLASADAVRQADIILCLSGGSDRFNKTAALLKQGVAKEAMVTTMGGYRLMLARKVRPDQVHKPAWSAASTYEEGLLLKEMLADRRGTVLVVSDPYHLHRVRWTFRHLFAGSPVEFAFISSEASAFQGFWWSNPKSRVFVLSELPKILYYRLWHGLLDNTDDPDWAVAMGLKYEAFIRRTFGQ